MFRRLLFLSIEKTNIKIESFENSLWISKAIVLARIMLFAPLNSCRQIFAN